MINTKLLLSQDCLLAFQGGYEFVGGGLFGVWGFLASRCYMEQGLSVLVADLSIWRTCFFLNLNWIKKITLFQISARFLTTLVFSNANHLCIYLSNTFTTYICLLSVHIQPSFNYICSWSGKSCTSGVFQSWALFCVQSGLGDKLLVSSHFSRNSNLFISVSIPVSANLSWVKCEFF